MIELLLPEPVRSAAAYDDPAGITLLPGEPELVAAAVPKRRAEFTTVRHCARTALAALGEPPAPILRGDRGAPIWPAGIVGSMTHCAGYRAAAVAHASAVAGIGIDAEEHGPLPTGVLGLVSLPGEREHLASLPGGVWWERLLFSAKESVYKVWFPATGEWLGFEEASLTFSPSPLPPPPSASPGPAASPGSAASSGPAASPGPAASSGSGSASGSDPAFGSGSASGSDPASGSGSASSSDPASGSGSASSFDPASGSGSASSAGVTGVFHARILRAGPFQELEGRFLVRDGLVLTAITLAASPV